MYRIVIVLKQCVVFGFRFNSAGVRIIYYADRGVAERTNAKCLKMPPVPRPIVP